MKLHLFKCSLESTIKGITSDKTGHNLPKDICQNGQWVYKEQIEINPNDPVKVGSPAPEVILDTIKEEGYVVLKREIITFNNLNK